MKYWFIRIQVLAYAKARHQSMDVANTKDLQAVIDDVLKPRGFVKRRSSWYRHHPETILVLNLQKDDFGGRYYINLAVGLRALDPGDYPSENRCHVRVRLESMVPEVSHVEKVKKVFDLEDRSLSSEDRRQQIRGFIASGADFLEKFTTEQSVGNEVRSHERIRNRTIVPARRFLKLD
jgi:hypothetical protein